MKPEHIVLLLVTAALQAKDRESVSSVVVEE